MPRRVTDQPVQEQAPDRLVHSHHIVGVAEGAAFFDVNPATFSNWSAQRPSNGMPLPVRVLRSGTFYDLQELLLWWVRWVPTKGAKSGKVDPSLVAVLGLTVAA
jgi:hypothetical protein